MDSDFCLAWNGFEGDFQLHLEIEAVAWADVALKADGSVEAFVWREGTRAEKAHALKLLEDRPRVLRKMRAGYRAAIQDARVLLAQLPQPANRKRNARSRIPATLG